MERIQKVMAHAGVCSRRAAEEMIKKGQVTINGEIAKLGDKADVSKDIIKVDGVRLGKAENKVYYLLNKPRQTVSTAKDEKDRKTVTDLIDSKERLYPVGRLDYDTTGALLLTNDGELTNLMLHPSNKVEKVYIVIIKGKVIPRHIEKLKGGVILDDGYKTAPCKAELISYDKMKDKSKIKLSIHEGKNRQVRRMIESVGFRVSKLHRESFGVFTVKEIKSGDYIQIDKIDLEFLFHKFKKKKR